MEALEVLVGVIGALLLFAFALFVATPFVIALLDSDIIAEYVNKRVDKWTDRFNKIGKGE